MTKEEIKDIIDSLDRFIEGGMCVFACPHDNFELASALQDFLREKLQRPENLVAAHRAIMDLVRDKHGSENVAAEDVNSVLAENGVNQDDLDIETATVHVHPATPANVILTAIERKIAATMTK